MNLKKLILGLGTIALAVASAAGSYDVTIGQPTWVGTTQLKPGAYKLSVEGNSAVFKSGKTVVEAPATVETIDRKAPATQVETTDSKIKQILLGGTKTKLVFNTAPAGETSAH
jgi:hypothetical protein